MQQIDFSQLKEYDSLSKREQQLLREIDQENARIDKINSLIESHLTRRKEIKANIVNKNSLILDNESQLKILSEQTTRLIEQGSSEEKIAEFQKKISDLEEESFSYLEEIDALENELQETVGFENGARKTLQEIETEVKQLVQTKDQELELLKSHKNEILEKLPENIRNTLIKLSQKNLSHGPFTKIEAGSCMMCRFKISKIDENEIDVHKLFKQCPQCSRIFLPYGV